MIDFDNKILQLESEYNKQDSRLIPFRNQQKIIDKFNLGISILILIFAFIIVGIKTNFVWSFLGLIGGGALLFSIINYFIVKELIRITFKKVFFSLSKEFELLENDVYNLKTEIELTKKTKDILFQIENLLSYPNCERSWDLKKIKDLVLGHYDKGMPYEISSNVKYKLDDKRIEELEKELKINKWPKDNFYYFDPLITFDQKFGWEKSRVTEGEAKSKVPYKPLPEIQSNEIKVETTKPAILNNTSTKSIQSKNNPSLSNPSNPNHFEPKVVKPTIVSNPTLNNSEIEITRPTFNPSPNKSAAPSNNEYKELTPITSDNKEVKSSENNNVLTKPSNENIEVINLGDIFDKYKVESINQPVFSFSETNDKYDYLKSSRQNIELGLSGELYVIEYEKKFLIEKGRQDLADKIIHSSQISGDYVGYDILSFNEFGQIKYIEVKTSEKGYQSDFFLTKNELDKITILGNYFIYRIFDFNLNTQKGSIYKIDCKNELDQYFTIEPTAFKVRPKSKNS